MVVLSEIACIHINSGILILNLIMYYLSVFDKNLPVIDKITLKLFRNILIKNCHVLFAGTRQPNKQLLKILMKS